MAPNFQSSFIPKGPMTEEKVFQKKKVGVFGVLAIFLLIISIAGSAGMYVYKGMVQSDITSLESQMASAEKSINQKSIKDMAAFSKKLEIMKTLVTNHEVIAGFLNLMSSSTVSTVQFTGLSYSQDKDGSLAVSLKGKATSYASVALQEDVFSRDKHISEINFSNLSLTDDGMVSFDLTMSVDSKISVYAP
jgi:hypothetical protein